MPERNKPPVSRGELNECRRCPLWRNATQGVPGAGAAHARIMLVGEQPGSQEDLQGSPFVGPAGHLLDEALQAAGLDRDKLFMTNAVKHFKFEWRGKRRLHKSPAQQEIEACNLWLERELEKVHPTVVVALGATAARAVLGRKSVTLAGMMETPVEHEGRLVIATYHPSFALRQRSDEARAAAFDRIVRSLRAAARLARGAKPG
ncbi:putative Uracil-DNA glycosylase [Cupriavidus taiwanensis]|uniref:UdgX family uracil-DNA binding protein n=1 Tax=Cupriavidus taiwanensis TaxID=164546 RepID=UPI000E1AB6E9|nr:UdgX family uracil-DNA binding protein [Cupriavidus taiwanensis]ULX53254.1 hydroxyacid dehydrogenase [Cupriavidus taiwanensis]SPA39532.1 putative Uracil-DNA glycosylase [Cupriavidus taiwanensis]